MVQNIETITGHEKAPVRKQYIVSLNVIVTSWFSLFEPPVTIKKRMNGTTSRWFLIQLSCKYGVSKNR